MAKKSEPVTGGDDAPIYAYDVPVQRIKALASVDSVGMDSLVLLSGHRLKGLKGLPARKLKQIRLAGGQSAFAIGTLPGRGIPILSSDPLEPDAFVPDARAQGILRGRQHASADLKDAGGTFDIDQVCSVLRGVTKAAIQKRVRAGSVIAVPGPGRRKSYPTFQFMPNGTVIDGLKDVQAALPTSNPWVVLNFLANPQSALGGETGIARLRAGDIATVVAAARSLGEQGG